MAFVICCSLFTAHLTLLLLFIPGSSLFIRPLYSLPLFVYPSSFSDLLQLSLFSHWLSSFIVLYSLILYISLFSHWASSFSVFYTTDSLYLSFSIHWLFIYRYFLTDPLHLSSSIHCLSSFIVLYSLTLFIHSPPLTRQGRHSRLEERKRESS